MNMVVRKLGMYEAGRITGEGTFVNVMFAQNTERGKSVAMKVLHFMRQAKFSTNSSVQEPQIQPFYAITLPHSTHDYDYLYSVCLRHCKKVQGSRFDEMPKRLYCSLIVCKIVHSHSLKLGFASIGRLANAIVDLYSKCGDLGFAYKSFRFIERKDTLVWNSILSMYSRHGFSEKVVESFHLLQNSGISPNQFSYAIVLSVCRSLKNVQFGKQVHTSIMKSGFEFDSFCVGSLIGMYASCGYVFDARRIFDQLEIPDNVSLTAMISGYLQVGLLKKASDIFEEMQKLGHVPDQVALVTVLNAYVGQGKLSEAWFLFSNLLRLNVIAWNVMISGHAKEGYAIEAIEIFHDMIKANLSPTRSTIGSVLSAIASVGILEHGLQVHALAMKQGLTSNVYVGSSLVNMYAKCQRLEAAVIAFDEVSEKNEVMWNALLGAHSQNGYASEAVKLFMNMKSFGFRQNEFTYTSILSACACLKNKNLGRQLHSIILKNNYGHNLFAGNALVDMYAKCGALDDAILQFELIPDPDHVSWNAIIVGYVQDEEEGVAFHMFRRMIQGGVAPDEVSLASILSACASIADLDKGKQIHSLSIRHGLETSLFCGSSLIDMYSKCGYINPAEEVFFCMPKKSVVSVNALIAGYDSSNIYKGVNLFQCMLIDGLKPSEVTFASLLDLCNDLVKLHIGKQIHTFVLKLGFLCDDEFLAISLLQMYMNTLQKTEASVLFSEFPSPKSNFLWTAMISGHVQNDSCEDALQVFKEMRQCSIVPDQATFASVLKACSILASLPNGRTTHALVFHTGFDTDEFTGSGLIDMYAKCGDVKSSGKLFNEMVSRSRVISWNSMIVGFAKNGYAEDALKVFDEMTRSNIKPDEVTFLGILTACSHAGMVDQGRRIFHDIASKYGVEPRSDHCACMIDLFGRWGFLNEAEEFIRDMKFEPNSMIWATYLGVCRLHGDEIRGKIAADKLIEMDPSCASPYILLSNMYASSGNWDEVNYLRKQMKERGIKKAPGCSWIVVGQEKFTFVAGDESHPYAVDIFAVLENLTAVMMDYEEYNAENRTWLDSDLNV